MFIDLKKKKRKGKIWSSPSWNFGLSSFVKCFLIVGHHTVVVVVAVYYAILTETQRRSRRKSSRRCAFLMIFQSVGCPLSFTARGARLKNDYMALPSSRGRQTFFECCCHFHDYQVLTRSFFIPALLLKYGCSAGKFPFILFSSNEPRPKFLWWNNKKKGNKQQEQDLRLDWFPTFVKDTARGISRDLSKSNLTRFFCFCIFF